MSARSAPPVTFGRLPVAPKQVDNRGTNKVQINVKKALSDEDLDMLLAHARQAAAACASPGGGQMKSARKASRLPRRAS